MMIAKTVLEFNNQDMGFSFNPNGIVIGTAIFPCENGMYCLSDVLGFINNNSNFNIKPADLINTSQFIDRLNALQGTNMPNDRRVVSSMKRINIYKTTGARENKQTFCNFNVLLALLIQCPAQVSAYAIMALTDKIFNTNIKKA